MSKICQITGKKAQIGNNVSHSKHRTPVQQEVLLCRGGLLDSVEDQRCWSAYD